MRRLFLVLALMAMACSTSSAPSVGLDASGGPGYPCDPSAAQPCVPTGDPCVGVACVQGLCTQFDLDGGPLCSASGAPCVTTTDCATGLACGFPVPTDGSNGCLAQGRCIDAPLACLADAASCGAETPACGCDGKPDPFVVPGYASSPVATLTPCPDGGPVIEAGSADAADGATE
jgi:hypothetical protein